MTPRVLWPVVVGVTVALLAVVISVDPAPLLAQTTTTVPAVESAGTDAFESAVFGPALPIMAGGMGIIVALYLLEWAVNWLIDYVVHRNDPKQGTLF